MSPAASLSPGAIFRGAGHLALWLGLYFAGAYVVAALMLGRQPIWPALLACACAGSGLYLLDRVKLSDRALDPADLESHPDRHGFLRSRSGRIRSLALLLIVAGSIACAAVEPTNLLLPVIGVAGVIAYSAGRTSGARLKDQWVLKNVGPGLAIAAFAVILAAQSPSNGDVGAPHHWAVLVILTAVISADAMLCDVDDIGADRAHGTRSVPAVFGRRTAWAVAVAVHALAAAILLWLAGARVLRPLVAWALLDLGATVGLAAARPRRVRDLVDLKLPLVAATAWMLAESPV